MAKSPRAHTPQAPSSITKFKHPSCTKKESDKLVAVVVTINGGNDSYDNMFRSVPQDPEEGARVSVYDVRNACTADLLEGLRGSSVPRSLASSDMQLLLADLAAVEPDTVAFNWECCGCCDDTGFCRGSGMELNPATMELMKLVLDRGHMVMCSDFSLKALIGQWNTKLLGPNPFIKLGEFNSGMEIQFSPATLAQCPSAQLQQVGELCSEGKANVHAMGGTIVYTIDPRRKATSDYTLEVLTVATHVSGFDLKENASMLTTAEGAGDLKGTAGHVLLTYPSGGTLLTSAGHWVELMKLDTTADAVFQMAEARYGSAKCSEMRSEWTSAATPEAQEMYLQSKCQMFVQNTSPCKTSSGWR